jgi:LacI family transcriptional regulator
VQRRSFALGVVVPDLDNPFFTEVVSGAERVASEAGYGVLLADAREIPGAEHVQRLRERQVDGVILGGGLGAHVSPKLLGATNVVVVDEPTGAWPGVVSDALGAGQLAGEHLLSLGHRRLAFLGPASPSHAFRMRERGFVQALRGAGVPLPSPWLRRVAATVSGGEAGMQALLKQDAPHPTGVFCANDLAAVGALKACHEAGISVPGDLSIVGCDDIELARYVTPELTTIRVPARGLGARAARLLLMELDGRDTGALTGKPLSVELVVRGTSGTVPEGEG